MTKCDTDERAIKLGEYIAETRATVRAAAALFGVSKSTVHKDVTVRLLPLDIVLHGLVREVLEENKAERHIRGGMATKLKYRREVLPTSAQGSAV